MIVTPNKSLRLLSAAEGNEDGPLSPIRPNSSSVLPLATDGTPLSQLSTKVHSSCSTGGRRSSRDGIGTGSNFEKCSSSKRRRVSDEENLGLTPMKLLSAFIESSSYRQRAEVESDYDSDEEEDAATRHEREKSDLLERLQEASSSRVLLEGGCDVVVLEVPRAMLYQSKDGEWINKGIVKIKFLKDVEKGEYTYGMIRMSMTSENLEETITVEINDMPANRMKANKSSNKPTYVWRARATPTYALRFVSIDEGLQWKEMFDRAQRINYCVKTGTEVDEVTEQMKNL